MLRHVVLLRFTDPGVADEVVGALRELPARVPSIRSYEVTTDAGLAEGNAHVCVTADFDDADGHAAYTAHPDHVAVIDRLIRPNLESRSAVQFHRDEGT